uniref:Uncharacterized protein n=1 Tax=Candidatus Kentrum sp. TUN TaxID=2126343 RepID=A0A451AB70_9GAMM|nr:MAG: hypothetical protein BECKTUN1418D_GA0071000_12051 [Candidatus Kentron sp. TUN]
MGKTLASDASLKKELLDRIEKRARLGLFCAHPKVPRPPDGYLNFAREIGLVMKHLGDQDTYRRVYKYRLFRERRTLVLFPDRNRHSSRL